MEKFARLLGEQWVRGEIAVAIRTVLDPQERQVLELRYGLDGGPCMTLREVGEILELSRQRVRLIEVAAFRKLRDSNLISAEMLDYCPPAHDEDWPPEWHQAEEDAALGLRHGSTREPGPS